MPQKKNPDFAELIRGRTGLVYGNLVALLTMIKGLPLAYNRDLQEDKTSLFAAYDTASGCLDVFTPMIQSAAWNTDRMAASCKGGHADATDLADYLVRRGLPFRDAHGVAARIVRRCIEGGCGIADLPLAELRRFSPLIDGDLYPKLDSAASVAARCLTGGPAEGEVVKQIAKLRSFAAGK
jgi:argininosuccinate lyase